MPQGQLSETLQGPPSQRARKTDPQIYRQASQPKVHLFPVVLWQRESQRGWMEESSLFPPLIIPLTGLSLWNPRFLLIYLFSCAGSSLWHANSQWDLIPWPGIQPGPLALRTWSLSYWTTREVPGNLFYGKVKLSDQRGSWHPEAGRSTSIQIITLTSSNEREDS